jgi:hypothetical protein
MLNENRFLGTFRGHNTRTDGYRDTVISKTTETDANLLDRHQTNGKRI